MIFKCFWRTDLPFDWKARHDISTISLHFRDFYIRNFIIIDFKDGAVNIFVRKTFYKIFQRLLDIELVKNRHAGMIGILTEISLAL